LLETTRQISDNRRFVRLTKAGRLAALGGRDPESEWGRSWDGKWRLIVFDLPVEERALRKRINRSLLACRCGRIQGSVWVAPSVPDRARKAFREHGSDLSHLMVMETVPVGRSLNRRMALAAWDFGKINRLYEAQMSIARKPPGVTESRKSLQRWMKRENDAWLKAVWEDPLLPQALHPAGYLGVKAWKLRRRSLRKVGPLIRAWAD
jgi:phenylacetic acid degradation operon negative regulatory protein